ncbi:MAG: hypothetical protein BroJett003_25170 [Planctomycetota bacterium]|nr:MAG: hypothetical protein BroJett003_25170 [Planctomycetota bacterium]
MDISPDFRDLLNNLKSENVRFLVVGAYAVIYHTEPRYTKDLDIWIEPTEENARRTWRALVRFGAPLKAIVLEDLVDPESVYTLGVEPHRVDVLKSLDGVRFATAWRNRVEVKFADVRVGVLSRADLIRSKIAAGRPQDLLDVATLRTRPKIRGARKARTSRGKAK